jgi:hypothetical protein
LEPLVKFVKDAHPAGDRIIASGESTTRPRQRVRRTGWRKDAELALFYLKSGGPSTVVRKIRGRIRRARS